MDSIHSDRNTIVTCNMIEKYGVLMIRENISDLSPEDEEFFREEKDKDI